MNTLNSPYSNVISISNGYHAKYQAVLDFAIANTISTPTLSRNITNDAICRFFDIEEVWDTLDLFYYLEQEEQSFSELNWVDPSNFRLYNDTDLVPDWVSGSGAKSSGTGKFYKTGFIPKTHSTKALLNDVGALWKTFDIPTTWSGNIRVFGCTDGINSGKNSLLGLNIAQDEILLRLYSGDNVNKPVTNINSHFHHFKDTTNTLLFSQGDLEVSEAIVLNGNDLTTAELYLMAYNNNGTPSATGTIGLSYFGFGAEMKYQQKEIYNIIQGTYFRYKVNSDGVVKFTTADITPENIFWIGVYKTSKFPTLTGINTPYFVLYSTNHNVGDGGIYLATVDNPQLDGFTEQGLVLSGYQAETPCLVNVPNDPDGHFIHLYYHTDRSDPSNANQQQSHLLTRAGGSLLDTAGWTQRGTILGLTQYEIDNFDPHTGYLSVYVKEDGSLVGLHSTSGNGGFGDFIFTYGKSTSTDHRTWTRVTSDYDISSFMPYGRGFQISPGLHFTRNGQQYILGRNIPANFVEDSGEIRISIFKAVDFLPTEFVGNISLPEGGNGNRAVSFYIEGNVAYIFYVNEPNVYHTTFDLTQIDLPF